MRIEESASSFRSEYTITGKRFGQEIAREESDKKPRISYATHRFKKVKSDDSDPPEHCDSSRSRKSSLKRIEVDYQNRKWVYSSTDYSHCKDRVIIVSYNILGVENASKHTDLYHQVHPKILDWDQRKSIICKEICHYMPGILCLQEVDRFSDLANILQKKGYKGVYKARTGVACDGCALFWKEDVFTLVDEKNIEFEKFGLRNNVAQLCVLKMLSKTSRCLRNCKNDPNSTECKNCRYFLVGNIHVLFNPKRGDIKLGQIRLFLEKAHEISQKYGNLPVILSGDLNSIPQSALYRFLVSSELNILMHDRKNISGHVECSSREKSIFVNEARNSTDMFISKPLKYKWSKEEISIASGNSCCTSLQHHLKLCSAYVGVPGSETRDCLGEPMVTSYHSKFMGTVDYIWHSEHFIPVGVVETLPVKVLRKMRGLPTKKLGSDHLALACEFVFASDANISNATNK